MSYRQIILGPADAERYARLRHRMLSGAPWAFGSDVANDRGLDVPGLQRSLASAQYSIFAVEHGEELVAAVGIHGSDRPKHSHRASIWGMWVDVQHRGRGHSKVVLRLAMLEAWRWGVDFIDLAVSERATAARSLYDQHGFVEWGRQPEALDVDGERFDESFMTRRTPGPAEVSLRLAFATGELESQSVRDALTVLVPDYLTPDSTAFQAQRLDGVIVDETSDADGITTISARAWTIEQSQHDLQLRLWHSAPRWIDRIEVTLD